MIDDVSVHFQIFTIPHVYGVALTQRRNQRLLHRRQFVVAALDLHRVVHSKLLLLDLAQLGPIAVLDDHGLSDPQRFAVDLEDSLASVVLDPVVIPDREDLLLHLVTHRFFSPFFMVPEQSHWKTLSPVGDDISRRASYS
jgi:hypothetical protein